VSREITVTTVPGLCSVICTTYNNAAYSAESIQSIYDQIYRNIEIIIIDDGSKDDNVEVIRRKLEESPFPAKLLTQVNTGNIGLNVNRAIEASRGQFLCGLSLDDLLLADCVSSKMVLFEEDPNLALVANTSHREIDGAGHVITEQFKTPLHDQNLTNAVDMLEHEFYNIETFYTQGMVVRRNLIDAVGGYDADKTGDDLIIRTKIWRHMIDHSRLRFALLPQPAFSYRKHGGNMHHNTFRQLRTILEWRDAYFPGRPLPPLFARWTQYFIDKCSAEGRQSDLQAAIDFSPDIKAIWTAYRSSWKYRRRAIKRGLRRAFSIKAQKT
jgi:glycosyltransferase involved in cell wall biosynthesis